ncbi:MAG: hypothetical protein R2823_02615 [Acidimicrobiia bacterium]
MGALETTPAVVRIALDTGSEVGNRTLRTLLSEAAVDHVGILDASAPRRDRAGPVADLASYDTLVSDGTTGVHTLIGRATVAGIPLVLWKDLDSSLNGPGPIAVVHGANVATALTAALTAHPAARPIEHETVRIGWTEPGKPLKRGRPMHFPEPIGSSWTKRRGPDRFVAFRNDEWAGAVIDSEGTTGRRIVGVSDHGAYLEAIVLAAVALEAAAGTFDSGFQPASSKPEHLLNTLDRLELELAVWRSNE